MTACQELEKIHVSVLPLEVLDFLQPQSGGTYMDGTLGLGGHSRLILEHSAPDGRVVGFDWDREAIARCTLRLKPYLDRLQIVRRNYAEIAEGLAEVGVTQLDGILLDVGLSSLQLDVAGRGFSFRGDEPLDMRMDDRREVTAASILAKGTQEELADLFYYYGEEVQARPIAARVVAERKVVPITTTRQLADLVAEAVPRRFHPRKIHVATKVFQALRIAVNTELENLAKLLDDGPEYLRRGARICVISFHSLEDTLVKRKFKEHPKLKILTSRPIVPGAEELRANPRSRSARLRVAECL
ncbi:MAG: 16S rRNA (cytosine(1402)-N(4))-methyltransferase [Deltaproteobacteria bacterium]|nr:MAG: 16S rRNA (cytosine(1402)-N(4))-methyltransferase [Deltaproteobacteria bacterium]